MRGCFAKVVEQQATTAQILFVGILQHGFDAPHIAFVPIFVHTLRYVQLLAVGARLRVDEQRRFFERDIFHNAVVRQQFQLFVHLLSVPTEALPDNLLVDVHSVGENACV